MPCTGMRVLNKCSHRWRDRPPTRFMPHPSAVVTAPSARRPRGGQAPHALAKLARIHLRTTTMQNVALDAGPIRLTGALDVDRRPTGIVPRRLPHWTRPQVPLFMEIVVTMPS